ncbi:MAG: TonB-dependent receptor [Pyrinomonadaceae bacterium]|nr:TonB-dependent receptor [Pyrinomonadaceae bacterium]
MFCKLRKIFPIVLVIVLFGKIFGQNGGTVSGTVTDNAGAVIVGGIVKALDLATNREITAVTDGTGRYQLKGLRPGTYRISATAQGFATLSRNVLVTEGSSITEDFSLSPGAIQDVVTVTAARGNIRVASEVPQTVSVTTAEDIERRVPRSSFEAIERTPNIIVRETNPSRERPRLRGLDSSRVLIVIDGERLNNVRTDLQTGLSPSIIDITQLEVAEVVSGAGSSIYGSDSLAGTINFVTKRPQLSDKGLMLSLRFDGNYSTNGKVRRGNGVINLSNEKVALRLSGSLFRLKNYTIGNRAITLEEVINFGNFFKSVPAGRRPDGTVTFNGPGSYAIFSVPAGGEVLFGAGHGYNAQMDFWVFPNEQNSFRLRYIRSDHSNLQDAFSGPPYESQQRFNPFRNYDKISLRYEGVDFSRFLTRVAANFYHQKLSFPQGQYDYTNQAVSTAFPNGSWSGTNFTGNPSVFTLSTFTNNKNTITTLNFDGQANIQPFSGLLITIGAQRLKDSSRDEFLNHGFFFFDVNQPNYTPNPVTFSFRGQNFTAAGLQSGASSPNTNYEDRAFFLQAELDRFRWIRISSGFRIDNWRTKAMPSDTFPLRFEFGVLNAAYPSLQANPGPLASQVAAIPQLLNLAGRTGEARTSKTSYTGNIGLVFRLPFGINPYFRYGNSYREPSITERYIIRNFPAFPGLVAIVVGNPNLEPERGRNFDVGLKARGRFYNASFGYFYNDLRNLIIFQIPPFGNICVAPNPSIGLLPLSAIFAPSAPPCAVGQSAISFNGRINQARNVIKGFEGTGEVSIPIGDLGSINPFVSFGTLHGTNKSPTELDIFRLQYLQNLQNKPIEIGGSATDFPLANITPYRVMGGAQFFDKSGSLFIEYAFRHQGKVRRVPPGFLTGTTLVNYGTYASLNSFTRHDIRGGYTWRTDKGRISLNLGITNIADRLYWEHFQTAPAPGRSFVFGVTTEIFNVFNLR